MKNRKPPRLPIATAEQLGDLRVFKGNGGWRIYDPVKNTNRGPYPSEHIASRFAASLIDYYTSSERIAMLPCGCLWDGRGPLNCTR